MMTDRISHFAVHSALHIHLHTNALLDADTLKLLFGDLAFSLSLLDLLICLCSFCAPLQLISFLTWISEIYLVC